MYYISIYNFINYNYIILYNIGLLEGHFTTLKNICFPVDRLIYKTRIKFIIIYIMICITKLMLIDGYFHKSKPIG